MSNPLVLKFGTDFGDTNAKLGELVGSVTRNMALVSAAAVATSKVLRTEVTGGAADAAKSIASYALTWDNAKVAAAAASEVMKVGFALHHPVLALGTQLLGNYKYALGAVAIGALAAVEAVKFMADQVERVNHVIASAEKAGVSGTFFQVWTDQAVKARVSTEEMERALQHASTALTPRFDATTGRQVTSDFEKQADYLERDRGFNTKSLAAFATAGQDVEKLQIAGALLVQDFANAAAEMEKVGSTATAANLAARGVQVATQLWGENGRKFYEATAAGKLSVEDIARKASELATVYSEDLLTATKNVNQELAEARKHFSDEMSPALEGLVRMSNDMLSLWAKLVDKAASFVGWLGKGTGSVDFAAAALNDAAGGLAPVGGAATGPFADVLRRKFGPAPGDGYVAHEANVPTPPTRPSYRSLHETSPTDHSPAKTASDAKAAIDTYIESLEKANAVAKAELETIGKSNTEKAKAVDLARAEEAAKRDGNTLTDEQRAKVLALATAEGQLKDQVAAVQKAQQDLNAAQHAFADTAENAIEGLIVRHEKFADVLRDVVKQLETMALKSLLTGGGPLGGLLGTAGKDGATGGLFGSLLGGAAKSGGSSNFLADLIGFNPFGFSAGGVVGRDGAPMGFMPASAWAGARRYSDGGAVNIIAHEGEVVVNAMQQKNLAGALKGGGRPNVTQHFNVSGAVSSDDVQGMVRAGAAQLLTHINTRADRSW